MLHCHVAFVPITHDFIDFFAPGENTFAALSKNLWYGYTEEISPEIYQSELNWRKSGVPYTMILQNGRVCDLVPVRKKHKREVWDNPEHAIRALAAMAVHDINVWGHNANRETINKFWRIRRELNIDDVVDYHGYWNSSVVKSASPKVYCGWYEWQTANPYRRVLIVSNFNRTPVPAALEIDWKELGVEPPAQFRDLWNNRGLSADELSKTIIPGAHFMLIGIK